MKQIGDIREDLIKKHLCLDKIFKLPDCDKSIIIKLYNDSYGCF